MRAVFLKSLGLRFLFASTLWVVIATGVAGVVISSLYRSHLTQQFHDDLDGHLAELTRLLTFEGDGRPRLDRPLSDPRFQESGSGYYWQIVREGFPTLTSPALGAERLDGRFSTEPREQAGWVKGPRGEVMQCGMEVPYPGGGPPLRLAIAADRSVLEGLIAGFNHDLALSLSIFAALMLVGATLQIRYGLRPARLIADDIENLRRGKTARLPADVPSEFGPLVSRLNALLDSQTALVARARLEAGNLAHGLRTPLALISDEAGQIGDRGEANAAGFILAQCRKIQRQVDYHMKRASAAGARPTGYVANVGVLARQIVSAMQRLHADKRLGFTLTVPDAVAVNCDEGDLAEIMSNLIDNACKWAETRVTVTTQRADDSVIIDVQDDGPGIAPDLRAHVFDVGARLDESKTGSGLGLAISRDLARLYGGELDLAAAPGGGLLARLSLPVASAP